MMEQTSPSEAKKTVKVEQSVLKRNDEAAIENRAWLDARRVTAVNLISSPGTGKTTLLEKTLAALARRNIGCGVIVGDVQTDLDAQRLSGKGAQVRQIETKNSCHLDALRVGQLLPEVVLEETRLLFIENVGNLICPASFNLGEDFKAALLSTTEGEEKPLKYPSIFSRAKVVILTKCDLIPHLDFDLVKCRENIAKAAPQAAVFELSAKTGEGLDKWVDYLADAAKTRES